MLNKILFFTLLLAVSPHFAQEAEINDVLDRIQERKSHYVRYDSFISTAYSITSQMDKNWTPSKTTIVEKKIIQEKNRRLEEIMKATELKKGKESDIKERKAGKKRK
jgi:hypothetical protein